MFRKEGLKTESGISENIKVLLPVGKDKVKGVGFPLLSGTYHHKSLWLQITATPTLLMNLRYRS